MEPEQTNSIAERFITELHCIEEGDTAGIDRMVEMFADDAELTNPNIEREARKCSGHHQIAEFWRNYCKSFKQIHSEFLDVTASDHSVGLFWRSTGMDAAGHPLAYEGVSLLTLDDAGKIQSFKGYFDSRQVTLKH